MSDLQEVLKRLPKLSKPELQQVRQRLNFLAGPQQQAQPADDWLLASFLAELKRRGFVAVNSHARTLAAVLPKDYAERAEPIRAHLLEGYRKEQPTHTEKLALGGVAAVALSAYLGRIRVPLGPKTLFANIDKVPLALEEAFPGYWGAKALGACLRQY